MRLIGLLTRLIKPGPSCAEKLAEADAANLRLQRQLGAVLSVLESDAIRSEVAKVIHRNDLNAGHSGRYDTREADIDNANAVLAYIHEAAYKALLAEVNNAL